MKKHDIDAQKGGSNMQQRHFSRVLLSLLTILVMAASLAVLGCDGDDEGFQDAELDDLAGRTFTFPGEFFNAGLAGRTVTVVFGAVNNDRLPFTLTVTPPGAPAGQATGIATSGTITLDLDQPLTVAGVTLDVIADLDVTTDGTNIEWTNPQTNVTVNTPAGGGTGTTGTTGG
jgi:hypothetical protein